MFFFFYKTKPIVIDLNDKGKSISNKLKQKVLRELLNYNLSIKYIARENKISSYTVRKILENVISKYPNQVKNSPKVISFDEFQYIENV